MVLNEEKMDRILIDLGHDEYSRGTAYIRYAVRLYEPGMALTKEVYPAVAKRFGTTPSRAERAMRYTICKAWGRSNLWTKSQYFGSAYRADLGRPAVGEYIARLAYLTKEPANEN